MQFAPGQVITVFRSRLAPGHVEEYAETAARMNELARSLPGYVEHKAFTAEDGERVTLVTFADHASQQAWRSHVEHQAAQRRGRDVFYETYSIQVADVIRVSGSARNRD